MGSGETVLIQSGYIHNIYTIYSGYIQDISRTVSYNIY